MRNEVLDRSEMKQDKRGTAKSGTRTSGKEPIRTLGSSSEKIWNREGALRKPVAAER
jgi:hypothetical protein